MTITCATSFFQNIQIIEKHIKSILSYSFTAKYGSKQQAYCAPQNYDFICVKAEDTYFKCAEVKRLVRTLQQIVKPPFDHHYIEHQWTAHHNVPLWATLKAVTLGTASKMYSLCTQDVQAAVAKEFPEVRTNHLIGMLDFLTRVRNVCAHNERLYDFNTDKRRAIQAMPLHRRLNIVKKGNYYHKGQYDLFAAVVCFKYLLSPEKFLTAADAIKKELSVLCARTKQIPENKILKCMEFPLNWYDSTLP